MSEIAIYARKSVFREDSISIESQIEECEYETRGENYRIYKDNGYSGKNTDRPDFQRMLNDIKAGRIYKVIVYKLDRVSRSVLDFSELMDVFQKYNVDFVSATEHFDTSNPMGRAMLNICIVFAQLERETIQQRVMDAYASRSKKGFYMGGKIPYGYKKIPIIMDGIKTSMYEREPDEAEDILLMYQLYSIPSATLGDVLRRFESLGINTNKRGKLWSTAQISQTLRNPIYTSNDISIYNFFKGQESNMINPPEEYNGEASLYLFKGENTNRKTWDLSGQNVVIAPHKGIVSPDLWIACRKKLLSNHQIKTCKPKNSFLAGKIKCGNCGYSLVVRFSERKKGHIRYLIDTGRSEMRCCKYKLPTIHADEFEDIIIEKMKSKLDDLTIENKLNKNDLIKDQTAKLETKLLEIDKEIEKLVNKLSEFDLDKVTIRYINIKIKKMDEEKVKITHDIDRLQSERTAKKPDYNILRNVMSKWSELSFEDKRSVSELLIEKILVYPDNIEIIWKV